MLIILLVVLLPGAATRWPCSRKGLLPQSIASSSHLSADSNCGVAEQERESMLWTVFMVLLVLWGIGAIINIGSGLLHLFLIVAAIALVFSLVSGRRGMA